MSPFMLSERLRKRLAASAVGKHGELLKALGGNAELHQGLKATEPFPYFPQRYQLVCLYSPQQFFTVGFQNQ